MDINKLALELHKKFRGKLTLALGDNEEFTKEKLSAYYTPGVGEVSRVIAADHSKLPEYTWTNNLVAVISDGSAVLGLGNIGPEAAMPVMEGKAMLFKHFANIDAVPIVLNVHTADEIVATVKAIAPSFGGINLEDIAAPICFEVEERLKKELNIPVFHDDQHGTAVVALAALINSCRVTGRKLSDCKIALIGAGGAGIAIAKLLYQYAKPTIVAVDSKGIVSTDRTDLNEEKKQLLVFSQHSRSGSLADALKGADALIGVSAANLVTADMIKTMAKDPIIIAMANPVPEIMPEEARKGGAAVIATGRSDYPNQVNNALAFPGIFRGALDNHVTHITSEHQIATAEAIASLVVTPTSDEIVPSIFDDRLVPAITKVIC